MIDMEKILEFDKIKEELLTLASTAKAREEILGLKPYLSETEAQAKLRETTEGRQMIEKCGNPPPASLRGIDEYVEIAGKGGCLTPEQLEEAAAALTAVKRWKEYLQKGKPYEIGLAWYEENLEAPDDILRELHTKLRNGAVDDYASGALKALREKLIRTEDKMHEKADAVLRANRQYLSDSFCTVKNGRLCIPVKKEYRGKINGSVVDKSSTGGTLFIEPAAAAKYYAQLLELKIEEENEVRRILYTLSALLSDKEEMIRSNNRTIGRLDFIFAKAKLSINQDGVPPVIHTERYIRLRGARHPLMDRAKCVPLDFAIGRGVNGIVITGPNTGGKTVAVKTVALTCLMAQCGLHVPCAEAETGMNSAILCDIGDGQNISENLSTFSAHITNVLKILERADRESLVVMDELGSGTDPAEGMGIAIAVLEELEKSGALFLVTTHYPEVKEYAEKRTGIVNARMTFDRESLKPLYQLVIGEAGESCAFYIAARLGMPQYMLDRAAKAARGEFPAAMPDGAAKTERIRMQPHERLQKRKNVSGQEAARQYELGDSVMVLPDKKIGIVCGTADDKGRIRVQVQGKKQWISHKRLRLQVAAKELYPEDYDFSIVFDSVETRKFRHAMNRKYMEGTLELEEDE